MFETYHKQKGLLGTIVVHSILLVIFVSFGMKYQDPPPETGVEIVFGFDKLGSGGFSPPPKKTQEVSPPKEESVKQPVSKSEENIMTQEVEDSPMVAYEKKQKIEKEKAEKKLREKKRKELAEKKKIKKEQDIKRKRLDGMFSNLKNTSNSSSSQGDDSEEGYKGSEDGSRASRSFYGNAKRGNYGNYQLGDRKPRSKPSPIYDGSDEGIVVVKILVNNIGRVIFAEAGVKGSTTTDIQLLKRAKEAAMKTTWQSDASAPDRQEGSIIYKFTIER